MPMTENSTDARPSHLWVNAIQEEDRVSGCYLVKEKRLAKTRNGKPFLNLTLADRTGEIAAKVWEKAEALSSLFCEGDIIQVAGHAGSYRDQLQITISGLDLLKEKPDPDIFVETTLDDPSEMMQALREILRDVKDIHLRGLCDSFLGDRKFVTRFRKSPAAKNFHHSYLGGLLEHTLSVCQLAVGVAAHYPHLDRDLLITSAFLHDIGKIRELACDFQIDYTDEGRLVGHVVLSVAMVDEKLRGLKDFPEELAIRLKHLILSHHGQYDFGSPKVPKFLEAFALNLIDDLDAKINGLSRFMERDRQAGAWTEFNRMFGRYLLKGEIQPIQKAAEERIRSDIRQGTLFSSDPET
jgi:3'-5' exoribonuclease